MYDEFGWLKAVLVATLILTAFMWMQIQTGTINVELTQSNYVKALEGNLRECDKMLDDKCEPCPEVKCVGDASFPLFIIGAFFGFILGVAFTLHFGNKFIENFSKQLVKAKKK